MDRWSKNGGPHFTPTLEAEMAAAAAAGDPVVLAELEARPTFLFDEPEAARWPTRRLTNDELMRRACRTGAEGAVAALLAKGVKADKPARTVRNARAVQAFR